MIKRKELSYLKYWDVNNLLIIDNLLMIVDE